MKKILLFELLLLFLATTFMTDAPPPGWYQQILPVNDQINDIFFLDSLTGWVVTAGASSSTDTGYIMKTTNGGSNWVIQNNSIMNYNAVQFVDDNTGYAAGGDGPARLFKTINGGLNWWTISSSMNGYGTLEDICFVNRDTGWLCDANTFGGLSKTTNGGINWQQQLNESYHPLKLFFLNKDTGWAGSNDWKLYRTTNGGNNWGLQYNFMTPLADVYFITKDTGFVSGGFGTHSIEKTTNGGFNWTPTVSQGGIDIIFVTHRIGFNCSNFSIVQKSTDGGNNWFNQVVPSGDYFSIQFADTSVGWSGGTKLIKTNDGGGPPAGIRKISSGTPRDFALFQNYPNPFNSSSQIRFQISKQSNIKLIIYDMTGRLLTRIIDKEMTPGIYEVNFDGSNYSSGVYFYSLIVDGKVIDTKKMILLK